MTNPNVNRITLLDFIARLDTAFARQGRLYLIGETTQVFEKWRAWTPWIEFTTEVAAEHKDAFTSAVLDVQTQLGVAVVDESPGDLIPLPDGYETRARPVTGPDSVADGAIEGAGPDNNLTIYHFDPYSVSFRFLARGDERDYHLVLSFLEHGWVTEEEMNARLAVLLPRFTAEAIQQDPAEFRRKYQGLLQMWRAVKPGVTHRSTAV